MVSLESFVLFSVLFNVFVCVHSLVELSPVEDNNLAITETVIRNSVNNLFSALKIKDVKHKPRLKEYSIVHNFFVSITLKDCKNLKEIVRLTRVHYIDNNTEHFITKINEVLDEGDKSNEAIEDITLNAHIQRFITKLREFNSNFVNRSINSDILKHLNKNENVLKNDSDYYGKNNYSEHNVLSDIEVWRPQEQSGRRIYHGHRTHIIDFPFMASVQFFEKFHCAGSIIQKDLVITAASCLQLAWNNRFFRENPNFLSVQVGCDFYEAGGENIGVYEIYFHPQYNPHNLRNNLAIMRLGKHIIFGKNVGQVKRIEIDNHASPLPANIDSIAIVGWGGREIINVIEDPWRHRLSFASLNYYPLNDCQEIYSKDYVTKKHFCAGFFTKGSGACNHDVGGPGIAGGYLVGVISFGPPICGTPDAPTVFTKVGFYKDWIIEIMEKNVPSLIKLTTKLFAKETFALHYSDIFHTTQEFTITPLLRENQLNDVDNMNTNNLIEEDRLVKEFLAVMFEKDPDIIGQKYDYDVLMRGAVEDVGEETINEGTTLSNIRKDKKTGKINIVNLKMGKEESGSESVSESEPQVQIPQMKAIEESTKPYKSSKKNHNMAKAIKKTSEDTSEKKDTNLEEDITNPTKKSTTFSQTTAADIISNENEDSNLEIDVKKSTKSPKTTISDISNSENYESKLEEDITHLLDDLDLQKLLESSSNSAEQKSMEKELELDKDSTEVDVPPTMGVKKTTKKSETNQHLSDSSEVNESINTIKKITKSQYSSDTSEVYVTIKKKKRTKTPTTIEYSSELTEEDIPITKRTTKTTKKISEHPYSSDSSEDDISIKKKTTKSTKKSTKTQYSSDLSEEDVIIKKIITKTTKQTITRKNNISSDEDTSDNAGGMSIA